jgi:hypothetical protein
MVKSALFVLVLAALALAAILGSCSKDSSSDVVYVYTVSGNFIKSGVDGKFGYGKLVAGPGGAVTDETLASAKSAAFSGGQAAFSMDDVDEGKYTAYAFIDVDGDASASNPMPDSGDWATNGGDEISVSDDFSKDVPETAWVLVP